MEVILLENIKKLGRSGEKVEVKNGYARNYLIPRGFALRANEENLAVYESKRAEIEKNNAEKHKAAEAVAKKINGVEDQHTTPDLAFMPRLPCAACLTPLAGPPAHPSHARRRQAPRLH